MRIFVLMRQSGRVFTVCVGVKLRDGSVFIFAAAKSFLVLRYNEQRCVTGLKGGDML